MRCVYRVLMRVLAVADHCSPIPNPFGGDGFWGGGQAQPQKEGGGSKGGGGGGGVSGLFGGGLGSWPT